MQLRIGFQELLRKCLRHGFLEEQQVCQFYRGLTSNMKSLVDASVGGSILNRYSEVAMKVIEEMAMNSYQWSAARQPL